MLNDGLLTVAVIAAAALLFLSLRFQRIFLRMTTEAAPELDIKSSLVVSLGEANNLPAPRYKTISVWIDSNNQAERSVPLLVGHTYTLNFKVGLPELNSLVPSQFAKLLETDIPEAGLDTQWVVLSRSVLLSSLGPEVDVTVKRTNEGTLWKAQFALHIPYRGESEIVQLGISARARVEAGLEVLIFVRGKLYRRFEVELEVAGTARVLWSSALGGGSKPCMNINDEVIEGPATQIGLTPGRGFLSQPGEVTIAVLKQGGSFVHESRNSIESFSDEVGWYASVGEVSGRMENLREAAEAFRAQWEDYLNDIDSEDLLRRLSSDKHVTGEPDEKHIRVWNEVAKSREMRDLAFHGYALYQAFFPPQTELRKLVDEYDFGWRLNIKWSHITKERVPHVPWGLMYRRPAPNHGEPVDPFDFLGLRFRISYSPHAENNPRFFGLGDPNTTFRANCMYWGGEADDLVRAEALWQQRVWGHWPNQIFVPSAEPTPQTRDELLAMLDSPSPAPMPFLYIFCQCDVGKGNKPVLRFGPGNRNAEMVDYTDLSVTTLNERPLVFINACLSSAGGANTANELERMFFERGCSAYIGTETYMPIQLASRFAAVFDNYFYRRLDDRPVAAGEAMFQARNFLWRHYRNVGGLLYSYINKYDLFMASNEELNGIISWGRGDV